MSWPQLKVKRWFIIYIIMLSGEWLQESGEAGIEAIKMREPLVCPGPKLLKITDLQATNVASKCVFMEFVGIVFKCTFLLHIF